MNTHDCKDCGYAHPMSSGYEVDDKKFEEAQNEIYELLAKKFGTDASHDPQVEFKLIRRDKHERMVFRPLRYPLEDDDGPTRTPTEDVEVFLKYMMDSEFNLAVAWGHFETASKLLRFAMRERDDAKEKQAGKETK